MTSGPKDQRTSEPRAWPNRVQTPLWPNLLNRKSPGPYQQLIQKKYSIAPGWCFHLLLLLLLSKVNTRTLLLLLLLLLQKASTCAVNHIVSSPPPPPPHTPPPEM